MSTPAGWYDDPTRGGRLRYWDGSQWTEWVSENGQTASEPLGAPQQPASGTPSQVMEVPADLSTASERAAEPTPGIQPAPAAAGGTWGTASPAATPVVSGGGGGAYPFNRLGRVGHCLAAGGAVVSMLATGQRLTFQPSTGTAFEANAVLAVFAVIVIAGAGVAAVVANPWARLGGQLISAFAVLLLIGVAIAARTDGAYGIGDLEVGTAWWLLTAGAALSTVGLVIAAVQFTTRGEPGRGHMSVPPFGVVGFICALVGILVSPLAGAGAAAGTLGMHDAAASEGTVGHRGLSVAAVAVGVAAFVLWYGGFLVYALTAQP